MIDTKRCVKCGRHDSPYSRGDGETRCVHCDKMTPTKAELAERIGRSTELKERHFLFGRHAILCTDCLNQFEDLTTILPEFKELWDGLERRDFKPLAARSLREFFDSWCKRTTP